MSKFNSEEILWFVKYFYEWHTNKWSATHIIKHLPAFLEEYQTHDFELTSEAREAFNKYLEELKD